MEFFDVLILQIALASVSSYVLPPSKPKKLIRRCLPFIFANCSNLRELCLRNCPVVDSMLTDIPEGNPHKQNLIASESLTFIRRDTAGLASLDCGHTQITDASIEYLPLSLKAIYLNNTSITDKGTTLTLIISIDGSLTDSIVQVSSSYRHQ